MGSDAGLDFISMEFIEGKTLKQIIPSVGLPVEQALDYVTQIVAGLAKAHASGIIHRDLKPANTMVTPDGVVKLLDFGLARRVRLEPSETATLAAQSEIAGTPAYMSPEQARGEELDPRTDLFSLGAVLYELVTGQQAFSCANAATVLHAILAKQPTPTSRLKPDLPPRLEEIIH